jgi:hypothetical protein
MGYGQVRPFLATESCQEISSTNWGDTAQVLSKAIPNAKLRTLEGQTHDVDVDVLAPVLMEFYSKSSQRG